MEIITLDKDIEVFYVRATSFPDGIEEAYMKLSAIAPGSEVRRYFGISYMENGTIAYKTAAEEKYEGEGKGFGLENFTIRKGRYISVTLIDYKDHIEEMPEIFSRLLKHEEVDPTGYCLEYFLSEKDIRCMVLLKSN